MFLSKHLPFLDEDLTNLYFYNGVNITILPHKTKLTHSDNMRCAVINFIFFN